MAKSNSRVFKFILFFLFFLASVFVSIRHYSPSLPLYELSTQLVRKHTLPELTLSVRDTNIFYLLETVDKVLVFLDKNIRFFPSWITQNFWGDNTTYILLLAPIIIVLAVLAAKVKRGYLILICFVLWIFPMGSITQRFMDKQIIRLNYSFLHPLSRKSDWIWVRDDQGKKDYVARFVYSWNQKQLPGSVDISLSCLGHYRVTVNGRFVGRGPVFAQYPKVYSDTYSIKNEIQKGENNIEIECEYLSSETHEHEVFQSPGLYVSGSIKDGLFARNLGDWRFWRGEVAEDIEYKDKLPGEAGFTEVVDMAPEKTPTQLSKLLDLKDVSVAERPIKSLSYESKKPAYRGGYFDLGHYSVGYLSITGENESSCTARVSYHDGYFGVPEKSVHESQLDTLKIPAGEFSWEQFGRRAGRYLKIESDCSEALTPGFVSVQYPYDSYTAPSDLTALDQKIFQIAKTSLDNGLQDQMEDSLVREKALYVGDALAIADCLPKTENNLVYLKYTIQAFADSQLESGAIPAMAHSANRFIIPDYSLQWLVLLEKHLSETGDIEHAKKLLPQVKKVVAWTQNNLAENGFLIDKNNEDWWIFIDWTPQNRDRRYLTALQLWYLEGLKSADKIYTQVGELSTLETKINTLEQNLIKISFSSDLNLFSDSFSTDGEQSGVSLVTNALAGKLGYLNDTKSLDYFRGNLYTESPFSETWVIEWLLRLGEKDLARKTIRGYWGSMVNIGATSVYEKFKVTDRSVDSSHSHAWGCGPVFLYNRLSK